MTDVEPRTWKWIKLGCLGSVCVIAALLAWSAAVFGTAYLRGQRETVATQELERALPARGRGVDAETVGRGGPQVPAGRVVLDLTVGEFVVRSADAGAPIQVEAAYDTRSYRLVEAYEPATDGPWTYRLTFEETSWFKDGGLRALLGGSFPRIKIWLPPDVPLALEGRFGKGGTELDLGGLWLTDVDLVVEKGGLDLFFDEPLVAPLESLTVRARQGGTSLRRVGNASPRRLVVRHSMGGATIDLQGGWSCDSEVDIATSMGGSHVLLPGNAVIDGLEGSMLSLPPPRDLELPRPRLHFTTSARFGELTIVEPR